MSQLEDTTIYKISPKRGFKVKDYSENGIILEGFNYIKIKNPHKGKKHKPFSEQMVIGNNVEFGCFSENTIYRFNSIQILIDETPKSKIVKISNIWLRIFAFLKNKY